MRNLTQRVHPSIGAASTVQGDSFSAELLDGALDRPLNRLALRLALPFYWTFFLPRSATAAQIIAKTAAVMKITLAFLRSR